MDDQITQKDIDDLRRAFELGKDQSIANGGKAVEFSALDSIITTSFDPRHLELWKRIRSKIYTPDCVHVFVDYMGFSESYRYCSKCDIKEKI